MKTRKRRVKGLWLDRLEAMAEEWLTTEEASAYLKVKPHSLLRWVRDGLVPAYKLSGTKRHLYRFLARDLDTAITGRGTQGGEQ